MKSRKHWNWLYLKNRVLLEFFEKKYPEHPWLTEDSILFLESWFKKTDIGLEFGSGRRTVWFANHTSV